MASNLDRIDPQKVYDEMIECANRYAEAQYIADLADVAQENTFDKCYLALKEEKVSVETKKSMARSNPLHQEALKAYYGAAKEALKSKLEWQAMTTRLDFQRTLETTLRAEAQYINKARA